MHTNIKFITVSVCDALTQLWRHLLEYFGDRAQYIIEVVLIYDMIFKERKVW